jgi:flagellar hook protein FlgE
MGLASALSTALTGLTAAETTIDVVGNNLANSNTVGFKSSTANFATQFLQTMGLGSAPSDNSGGTNPRQTGLGTMVVDITTNYTQGTIEISSQPTDMAIQGDGFFCVQGATGEHLYTRNGVFKMNSQDELVTLTGNRVLGFGVDDQFQLQRTVLEPITIPLGSAAVAQATQNVYLEGQLSPTGDIATKAGQIQTDILSDGFYSAPDHNLTAVNAAAPVISGMPPSTSGITGGASMAAGTYQYRFVYATAAVTDPTNPPALTEGAISDTLTATVAAGDNSVTLNGLPNNPQPAGTYTYLRVYRRKTDSPADFRLVDDLALPAGGAPIAPWTDTTAEATIQTQAKMGPVLTGKYKYYVTYATQSGGPGSGTESRPNLVDMENNTVNVNNGRILLSGLPTPPAGSDWTVMRIYRSVDSSDSEFHYLAEIPSAAAATPLVDNVADDAAFRAKPTLNMDGPGINKNTVLTNVLRRSSNGFDQVFKVGTLEFTGQKGGRTLATKSFSIGADSTVGDLLDFMSDAMGIQPNTTDPLSPPKSQTDVPGVLVSPGGDVDKGRLVITGNNGVENAVGIKLAGMNLIYTDSNGLRQSETVNLPFNEKQQAVGESAVTDTIVYDSLGIPLQMRVTMALENRNSTETTYRWYADSPDNTNVGQHPAAIAVGTGTITFDNAGNFKHATQSTVNIHRAGFPSVDPLAFDLDFNSISGLATDRSTLAVSRQDGSAPGVLTSFIVGEDGKITGVFSNGVSRDLGQMRLVRFANPNGLVQKGQNLFAAGVNSGLPVEGDPGTQGIGSLIAGAVELSNTDIGGNLIDLILASTMYRGNTRVITTTQQMLDELLALRR